MNFLKKNKDFLKQYDIALLEKVKKSEKENKYNSNVKFDNNYGELRVRKAGVYAYLHSIYNSKREIEKVIEGKPRHVEQISFFGIPKQEQLEVIKEHFFNLKRLFVIVPSIAIFYKWLEYNDFKIYLSNFEGIETVFLVEDKFEAIENITKSLFDVGQHERVVVLGFLSYCNLYPGFFLKICKTCKTSLVDKEIMYNTRKNWRNAWLVNNWRALGQQLINVAELKNLFADNACIVVAAGSSLEKNINQLKEVGNRAIIIAAGTTIDILARNGIKPHFHIGVDGSDLNNKIYRRVLESEIPLICSHSFYMPLLEEYAGPKFGFIIGGMDHVATYFEQYLSDKKLVSGGGLSVVNVAHKIAMQLGCKKLILMGQDCCYTGNKVHAAGAWSENKVKTINEILTEDIDGNLVYTDSALMGVNRAIAEDIYNNPQCKVINATEGGLKIIGAREMLFKDVLKREIKGKSDIDLEINKIVQKHYLRKDKIREQMISIAEQYKRDVEVLKRILENQKDILAIQAENPDAGKHYAIVKKAIGLFESIQANDVYRKTMHENYVFDINELLTLDEGKYSYELQMGLIDVNSRLLEYVDMALILAEEFLEQRDLANIVMYYRQ